MVTPWLRVVGSLLNGLAVQTRFLALFSAAFLGLLFQEPGFLTTTFAAATSTHS